MPKTFLQWLKLRTQCLKVYKCTLSEREFSLILALKVAYISYNIDTHALPYIYVNIYICIMVRGHIKGFCHCITTIHHSGW